jgi:predicted ester cyclase
MWGMGVLGSEVNLTLLREGKTIQVTVKRGRVDGFDSTLNETFDRWKYYLQEEIPDVHTEINQIFAAGDWVAYFATSTGTHKLYNQSAVWTECSMVRLENGKIVEWWGLEDTVTQWGQFGYHFQSPVTAVQPAAP